MFKLNFRALFVATLLMASVFQTKALMAQELDSEKSVTNAKRGTIQGSVVFRVDTRDNSVSVLEMDKKPSNKDEAYKLTAANESKFKTVAANHLKGELDKDTGNSSWYFHYRPWGYQPYYYTYYAPYYSNYYPTYYTYGNPYSAYFAYNYGYYAYYYYGYNYGYYNGYRW